MFFLDTVLLKKLETSFLMEQVVAGYTDRRQDPNQST
jgi:hypothetical protein